MADYNGQRNYGTNRNFLPSFPRNNYGSTSEDHNMYMRRPFERDAQMYQRYDSTRIGSFSSSPQPSFSRFGDQTGGPDTSMDRPMNTQSASVFMANRASSQNTFTRSEFRSQDFQKPEFGDKYGFRTSDLNDRSAFPGSDQGNRAMFPSSEFTRNGMFSRPQLGSGTMYPGPPVSGNVAPRPMSSGNMLAGPQMNNSDGMFARQPQFDANPMSGLPTAAPRMQFPYGGGANQRSPSYGGGINQRSPSYGSVANQGFPSYSGSANQRPPSYVGGANQRSSSYGGGANQTSTSYGGGANQTPPSNLEWHPGPNWQSRNPMSGTATQKNSFAATQQNRPMFKPAKKKSKKRSRIPSKLKDDGKKLKPWMTDELYAEVKKKNEMYFKAKAADSTELWQEFRLQRNKVSSLIKEAKLKGGFLVRKKKEDEEDGKEKPYSCDTCDRAFAEESKLEEHLKEHKKCEIDGCQFEAHPKVVEVHKKLQHDTGYATIISKLNNDAEIEKWRNQRKSHFPTLENVKKRQAEQEERFARGEVLETKDFGSKNEDVKDSSQGLPQTQQDTGHPEVGGEDKEDDSGEVKTDPPMEN